MSKMTTDSESDRQGDGCYLVSVTADPDTPFDARLLIGATNSYYCLCCGGSMKAGDGESTCGLLSGLVICTPTDLPSNGAATAWNTVGGICQGCAHTTERARIVAAAWAIRFFRALDSLRSLNMSAGERLADHMRSLPCDRRRFFDLETVERFILGLRNRVVVDPEEVELLLAAIDPEIE
jgi:hypothetical protein